MRIDMTTRQWHELIRPVIPHAGTDKEFPLLGVIRLEAGARALYAAATDRYTLGAERHPLPPAEIDWERHGPAVHVRLPEAKASLGMFTYSKDDDPDLRITIDTAPVPVAMVGQHVLIGHLAVTVESGDGTRVVMHDARDPSRDPLASWKRVIRGALARPDGRQLDGLDLSAVELARWQAAVRRGERLTVWTGPKAGDPLLVTVEQHFAGVWVVQQMLDDPQGRDRAESRWLGELPVPADPAGGTVTTIDIDPAALAESDGGGPPPWVKAEHAGKCAGCGDPITPGDEIQADGDGGWVCYDCGTGDDDDE